MKITAAHGSGGKDTALLIDNLFRKYFDNNILDRMEDSAILDTPGKIAITTDSYVVTPLFFPGGDIGKLCVCGTVNDLLVIGAEPKYLTCGFILEEGLQIELLERIVASIASEAASSNILVVAGDTKVAGNGGGLYINTTGLGFMPTGVVPSGVISSGSMPSGSMPSGSIPSGQTPAGFMPTRIMPENRELSSANCKPGDKVILSGSLGDHHACILSARMGIESNIVSDCACLNDVVSALFESGAVVKTMRDVTRGGLATVLNELAAASCCRIRVWEESLPVKDNVKAFCALMGLDPLYMGNEGKLVAVVEAETAEKALAMMRETAHGREAAIIGEIELLSARVMRRSEPPLAGEAPRNTAPTLAGEATRNTAPPLAGEAARNTASTLAGEATRNTASTLAGEAPRNTASPLAEEAPRNTAPPLAEESTRSAASTLAPEIWHGSLSKAQSDVRHGETAKLTSSPSLARRGEVVVRTKLGGHRRLDMLVGEGLPRIC